MKKKSGFTLIELMATLAIFSILTVLLSGMYIQSYKISASTEKDNEVQDEYRKALMVMETDIKDKVADGYKVYIYKEGRRCGIINGEETPDGTGDNIFKGCDVAIPLVSIINNVTGSDHRIMYALVEQSKGSNVYNLEQVEFINTNNSSEENEESLEKFTVNPVQGTRKVLIKDVTSGLLSRDMKNENLISMKFIINTLNNGARSYETAINLGIIEEYNISIEGSTNNGGGTTTPSEDETINVGPAVAGIFNHYNPGNGQFYMTDIYEISGGAFFSQVSGGDKKTHENNCNHDNKDRYVYYRSITGYKKNNKIDEIFVCGSMKNSQDNIVKELPTLISYQGTKTSDGVGKKVGDKYVKINSNGEIHEIENYIINGIKYDILISNGDITIKNYTPQTGESFNNSILIVITRGNITITGNDKFEASNLALVGNNVTIKDPGSINSGKLTSMKITNGLLVAKGKFMVHASKFNLIGNLGINYTSTINIINKVLKGEAL